jgi:endonuclease/exonuclease/phosphatase family metal-dependent hydrolase
MVVVVRIVALAVLGLAGCGSPAVSDDGPRPRPSSAVRVVGYNVLAQVTLGSEPQRGAAMAARLTEIAPDLIGFTECAGCQGLIDQMPDRYALVTDGRAGVTAAYDRSRWRVVDHGFFTLGGNDDGWGERVALWVELDEIASGAPLLLYSTHWCVPSRRPDDTCDLARHLDYADRMIDDSRRRSAAVPIVVTGDLNAAEVGEEAVSRAFTEAGYIDAMRAIQPTGPIVTHVYGGRIDYVFASTPVEVIEAYVDESLPFEVASDHFPVVATFEFP